MVGPQPKHDDALWRIGVQNPHDARGSAIGVVVTSECSIVTSGIYERHLEVDGKSYHHILDSKTGYPKQNSLASITVSLNTQLMEKLKLLISFLLVNQLRIGVKTILTY